MDYELAKKLKNAGFSARGRTFIAPNNITYDWMELRTDGIIIPSLSELIEACGEGFISIKRLPNQGATQWWASSQNIDQSGYTAEEAVALLWIELNKKK